MRQDENTVRLLKRISRERDFLPFLEELARYYADMSITQEGPAMYRTQGMVVAVRELAKQVAHAANMP